MVVIDPFWIPKLSYSTLTTGARQLVVHEALETMLCFLGSYISSFTPSTIVTSSFLAGAEIMTFFTVPRMCLQASFASVNLPVDSTTICAPKLLQSICAGSLVENTL